MEKLLRKLQQDFPNISFVSGEQLHWSPNSAIISYNDSEDISAMWGLLHEIGHAILEHKNYTSDVDLLQKETAAWAQARKLSQTYNVSIDEEHTQDCLDTYRDWLHRRSTCPTCHSHGIERHTGLYSCLNCQTTWEVTPSRFCRPYRRVRASETKIAG
jgi:hypothetical protein